MSSIDSSTPRLAAPKSVRVLGIIAIILGALTFALTVVMAIVTLAVMHTAGVATPYITAIICLNAIGLGLSFVEVFAGIGMTCRKRWGRTLGLVFGFSSIPLSVLLSLGFIVTVALANVALEETHAAGGVGFAARVYSPACFAMPFSIVLVVMLLRGHVRAWAQDSRGARSSPQPLNTGLSASDGPLPAQAVVSNPSTTVSTSPPPPPVSRVSILAVFSLVLSIMPLVPLLGHLVALFLGIAGYKKIARANGAIHGRGMALAGILISCIMFLSILAIVTFALAVPAYLASASSAGPASPHPNDQPTNLPEFVESRAGKLDFRIGAQLAERSAHDAAPPSGEEPENEKKAAVAGPAMPYVPNAVSQELAEQYIRELEQQGPHGKLLDTTCFAWFEISGDAPSAIVGKYKGACYALLMTLDTSVMLADDEYRPQWHLKSAYLTRNQGDVDAVSIEFDDAGATQIEKLTTENVGRPLAFLIDGKVVSMPVVRSPISGSATIDAGAKGFAPFTAREIVAALSRGMTPANAPARK